MTAADPTLGGSAPRQQADCRKKNSVFALAVASKPADEGEVLRLRSRLSRFRAGLLFPVRSASGSTHRL